MRLAGWRSRRWSRGMPPALQISVHVKPTGGCRLETACKHDVDAVPAWRTVFVRTRPGVRL